MLGPFVVRLAIGPVGDSLAAGAIALSPSVTASSVFMPEDPPSADPRETPTPLPHVREGRVQHGHVAAPKHVDAGAAPPSPHAGLDPAAVPRGTIVVPASVVAQAIDKRDIGAKNAKAPDGAPLGARLHGVGRYHSGLHDGDVVIFVEGTRTETTSEMVDVATRSLGAGATKLTGKILRGDETWSVVLQLPPRS